MSRISDCVREATFTLNRREESVYEIHNELSTFLAEFEINTEQFQLSEKHFHLWTRTKKNRLLWIFIFYLRHNCLDTLGLSTESYYRVAKFESKVGSRRTTKI